MSGRDNQRGRLYAWEEAVIAPLDPTRLPFPAAQGMVDAIWADLGLRFPPKVAHPPRQARTTVADADRLTIRLPDTFAAWHLLHEIAHSLSSSHDGQSDGHGPLFVGLYVQLLSRYLRLGRDGLCTSLRGVGIAVNPEALPVFLDGEPT